MSEVVTENSRESEENLEATGSSEEGSSAETKEDGATASPPESDHEARLRYWQSKADKAESTARSLEQRLTQLEEADRESSVAEPTQDINALMEQMELRQEMREVRKELRDRYPLARTDVVNGLNKFRSLDDYTWAVEQSHRDVERSVQPVIEQREKAIRDEYEAKFGRLNSPPSTGGDAIPGRISVQDLAAMSVEDMDAFEEKNPGVIDSILREAEQ